MIESHGFLPDVQKPEDLVFGAAQSVQTRFGGAVLRPDGDWTLWLPDDENQSTPSTETNSCVSFGTLNAIETLTRLMFSVALNLSDRFVSKMSGTNPAKGNTPNKVADTIRHQFSVNENEWPFTEDMTSEEFFKDIPSQLKTLAIARGAEYEFGYERVSPDTESIREALKYSPIGLSVPAWFKDDTNRYYRPPGVSDSHWCMCYAILPNGDKLIFDTYAPFRKILRADCTPLQAMRYFIRRQIKNESMWQKFLSFIQGIVFGKWKS